LADSLEEHQERLRLEGPLLVRGYLSNLAEEIIDTDRKQRLALLEEGRLSASAHRHIALDTGESARDSINETIINLKSSSGALNQLVTLGGVSKQNLSSNAQREADEPRLNVKDPKKLRELHKLELSLMKDNIKYYGQQKILDLDFKERVLDSRKRNR